jgi:hypothetical protein
MIVFVAAKPRMQAEPRAAVFALARIEAGRMLRHPAPWLGIALTCWFAYGSFQDVSWSSAEYHGLTASIGPMLLGVSLAVVSSFGRELTPVADEAPMDAATRSLARLTGGLILVALVGVVIAAAELWLRWRDGIPLGDEPGRTLHAQPTLPELMQPVLLAGFAVALGAAVVHLVRNRLTASVVLFVLWYIFAISYWVFMVGALYWMSVLQVQPLVVVEIGTDPSSVPAESLLEAPADAGEWRRIIVSPALAAWHDVYLVGLTMLAVAVAIPGRWRRTLALTGALVAVIAVPMQGAVAP